jgi:cold shock CspA family protein
MKEHIIYERCRAQVKFYSRDKGFGFIKRPNKADIFLSQRELDLSNIPYVKENEWIEFDLVPVKGRESGKAVNIRKMEKS